MSDSKLSILKETSLGTSETIASDQSALEAKMMLAKIKESYAHDDIRCESSSDGKTLTCANPQTSSFVVRYVIQDNSVLTPSGDLEVAGRKFKLHCLNRDLFALSMLKYRDFQGYLSTGQHSGTHWVKWMMSHALAHQYNVEPPKYFDNGSEASNVLIGHPRHKPVYPHIPRIASTHSIPPYVMQWAWLRKTIKFPPYAIVVRDIRNVLISNYEKWKERYAVSFSEYILGDPQSNKYICDVWWYVRYMNRWGDVASKFNSETVVLHYEDFQVDRIANLKKIFDHFQLDISNESLSVGAAAGDKSFMAARQDPSIPDRALRGDGVGDVVFSSADMEILNEILDRYLRHDFGYKYFTTPRGFQGAANSKLRIVN